MTGTAHANRPYIESDREEILRVEDLTKHFAGRGGLLGGSAKPVRAVEGVSLNLLEGETIGLVGESGCGKTTLGRMILRLVRPTSGRIFVGGEDVTEATGDQLRKLRQTVQVVFQDPYASLDPRRTVASTISEPLIPLGVSRKDRIRTARNLMEQLGLNPAHSGRYPHQFSGGQRQRIGIARALSVKPRLLILDEPVSALDVSIQAQVLNILRELRAEHDLSYMLISHDLSVVRHVSERVAVMYLGRLVEVGERHRIFAEPRHPYTKSLLSGAPIPDPKVERERQRIVLIGDVPNPADPPSGCTFHPRCFHARHIASQLAIGELEQVAGEDVPRQCVQNAPALQSSGQPDGWVACHFPLEVGDTPIVAEHERPIHQHGAEQSPGGSPDGTDD